MSASPAASTDAAPTAVDTATATLDPETPTFESLGVPAAMAASLTARGILAPFPIQAATIPPALAGKDVCGRAPTGAGKTLAFGIPLVQRVRRAHPHRPTALVLAPTRELAAQICDELRQLADPDQTVEAFYGGVGFGAQLRALRAGVDIAVACPGRLADLIQQGQVQLGDVSLVVLDEADRMADMGFLPEVKRLLDACAQERQTLLFSATLDGDVDVIIRRYMDRPVRHEFKGDDTMGDNAEHEFWNVERPDRLEVAARIIDRTGPTVVFCRTKRGADRVAKQLDKRGVAAVAIHGDRSQNQRERALEDFRQGRALAIVATDVAARGIHVDGVTCVIHFDPSEDAKDYVHRSGRTGRAGAEGTVISFVSSEQRRDIVRQQRGLGRDIDVVLADPAALPEAPPFVAPPASERRPSGANRSGGSRSGGSRSGGSRSGGSRSGSRSGGGRPGGGRSRRQGARADGAAPKGRSGQKPGGQKAGGQQSGGQQSGGQRSGAARSGGQQRSRKPVAR